MGQGRLHAPGRVTSHSTSDLASRWSIGFVAKRLFASLALQNSVRQDGIDTPAIRNPVQLMLSGVLEREAGACDEVLHRLGDSHLRGARRRGDSCADGHSDPSALAVDYLAFTGVHARTDLDPQLP